MKITESQRIMIEHCFRASHCLYGQRSRFDTFALCVAIVLFRSRMSYGRARDVAAYADHFWYNNVSNNFTTYDADRTVVWPSIEAKIIPGRTYCFLKQLQSTEGAI